MLNIPENLQKLVRLLGKSSSSEEVRLGLDCRIINGRVTFARDRFRCGRDGPEHYFAAEVSREVPKNEQGMVASKVALHGYTKRTSKDVEQPWLTDVQVSYHYHTFVYTTVGRYSCARNENAKRGTRRAIFCAGTATLTLISFRDRLG